MKRCPECRRDYFDDSLLYCLDDGSALLDGPAGSDGYTDEPATAIMSKPGTPAARARHGEDPTPTGVRRAEQTAVLPSDVRPGPSRTFDKRILAVSILFVITALGVYFGYPYLGANTRQIESIAVMPFANESGDADLEFVCDGMTEALIGALSKLPDLSVKARNSVFRYKGREVDIQEIGKVLGVQAVLMGRVTKLSDRLNLRLELVNIPTETVIWSEEYGRTQADLVALRSEIARDVSAKLTNKLSGTDIEKIQEYPTINSEAYQLYLRGRFEWKKRQKEPLLRAVDYFERAIELDPSFALAYAGLADCYIVFNSYDVAAPNESYPKARAAILKALELDPNLAPAYASLAAISEDFDWDFEAAERNYRRSIEIDPNNPSAYQWFGEFLRVVGRFDEAIASGMRAVELDPVSLPANNSLGITYFYAGRCDDAITQQTKSIELDPNYPWPYARLADCYTLKKMFDEALPLYRKAIELSDHGEGATWVLASYGHALAVSGNMLEAHKIEQLIRNRQKTEFVEGDSLALLYYGLGDREAAFSELERAYRDRSPGIRYIRAEPRYGADYRSDPRYLDLIEKIGLNP